MKERVSRPADNFFRGRLFASLQVVQFGRNRTTQIISVKPRLCDPAAGNRDAVPGRKVGVGQSEDEQFEPLVSSMPWNHV